MDDIYIYTIALPDGINEAVVPCADGFTIYINEKLDDAQRYKSLEHALYHIAKNDWEKTDVQEIEETAHACETKNIHV